MSGEPACHAKGLPALGIADKPVDRFVKKVSGEFFHSPLTKSSKPISNFLLL